MFVEQLRRAVQASPRVELARVAQLLWRAYAAGHVTEAEASALFEAIELKRALPAAQKPVQRCFGSRPRHPPAWSAAGGGPRLEPCRQPLRAGSPRPRTPSWLSCRPKSADTGPAR
jgi:hypothetical protein